MSYPSAEDFSSRSYDFVIVGGGTAGLTLAARLTEDPSVTVGVIEAGGDVADIPEVFIPGMLGKAFGNERVDWAFKTTALSGANNREVMVPRGKGIGGSSALNYMVWCRASTDEYDAIEALGNPGWNWPEFLKYIKKAESFTPPPDEIKKRYHAGNEGHGMDGPVKVSFSHWFNECHERFLESAANLGVPVNLDAASGENMGASTGLFTIDPVSATRSYAATAYYYPNAQRSNLVLLPHARVARVVFKEDTDGDQVAEGVVFFKDGKEFIVKANREVLMCAGTFQTPQILELSGIGVRSVLENHGIKQLVDLPVGENLQDHAWVPFVHEVSKDIETYDKCIDPEFLGGQIQLYQQSQRGMLSGANSGFAYVASNRIMPPAVFEKFKADAAKDTTFNDTGLAKAHFDLLKKWLADEKQPQLEILQLPAFQSLGPLQRKPDLSCRYHTLLLIDLHPFSRGSVHISSKDPLAAPMIDAGYLKNPLDVEKLMGAVRFAKKMTETAPYTDSQPVLYDPTADVIDDDEKLKDWIRNRVEGIYHPVATCAMAPRASGGVVDPELRVYGTKNLRVVDASVIPFELSTHIQSTVYAMAEKTADTLKATYA